MQISLVLLETCIYATDTIRVSLSMKYYTVPIFIKFDIPNMDMFSHIKEAVALRTCYMAWRSLLAGAVSCEIKQILFHGAMLLPLLKETVLCWITLVIIEKLFPNLLFTKAISHNVGSSIAWWRNTFLKFCGWHDQANSLLLTLMGVEACFRSP